MIHAGEIRRVFRDTRFVLLLLRHPADCVLRAEVLDLAHPSRRPPQGELPI